ncbi:MAG: anion permease [Acidobacteria bacterium]|nr:anion permease [Acidobacteriota bacterium]
MNLILKLASGPIVFLIVYAIPFEGLSVEARIVLAIFGWMVVWWMAQPIPWAITSLLPLLLFPAFGIMNVTRAGGLYGQSLFFFLWGTSLVGFAMAKSGLAKRSALLLLSVRGMSSSTYRMAFGLMLVTALISGFVSDVAVVAIMMPIAISVVAYIREIAAQAGSEDGSVGEFMALGILYGAVAGGKATIAGLPHNALGVALLEQTTGRTLGWFNWMMAGVPIFLTTLVLYFLLLRLLLPMSTSAIADGDRMIRREREKLGPMTIAERGTLFVFIAMAALFMVPPLFPLVLGRAHPVAQWTDMALNIWTVPVIVLLLLFTFPVNWRLGESLVTWKECVDHTPWNILFLVTSAVGVTGVLVELGFMKFVGEVFGGLGMGPLLLPFVSAYVVAFGTNFFSGTAATSFFGSILIPAAQQIGFNPASMAMLIPNVATGVIFPWAGASPGLAFASGQIKMKNMIRVGLIVTLIFPMIVAGIHVLFSPIF